MIMVKASPPKPAKIAAQTPAPGWPRAASTMVSSV
jgi:hypothetical protein